MTDTPRQRSHMSAKKEKVISKTTFFVSIALVALVAFVAGTRSTQLLAAAAPLLGIKVTSGSLDARVMEEAYQNLKANYDGSLNSTALANGAARGMVAAAGDQYTVFMDKTEATAFNKELSGQVSGIGCEIGLRSDQPTVLRVIAGSPAETAGIKAGDVFVAINGSSVEGEDASTVANKVRGDMGTSVKLTMKRGTSSTQDYTITRAQVTDPSVRWSEEGTIGIMTISRFDEDTGDLARQAAQEFRNKGVTGVILDLRDDGGGYVTAAHDVASLWLNKQLIYTTKADGKVVDQVSSDSDPLLAGIKTVVLVNGGTASASEIVSGALQDHGVATLVGEKTFGKGTEQKVIDLSGGALLKVTVARWYTPKGKNITSQGITPDKTVGMTSGDANAGRDPQLDAAKALLP